MPVALVTTEQRKARLIPAKVPTSICSSGEQQVAVQRTDAVGTLQLIQPAHRSSGTVPTSSSSCRYACRSPDSTSVLSTSCAGAKLVTTWQAHSEAPKFGIIVGIQLRCNPPTGALGLSRRNEQIRRNVKTLSEPTNHREAKLTLAVQDLADAAGRSKHRYHVRT
jgi:hypothetical protein